MSLKIQLVLLFVIQLQADPIYQDYDDKYTLSLYLKEKDYFKLNVNQVVNFNSNSANFYCDNPGVDLPGISSKSTPIRITLPEAIVPNMVKSTSDTIMTIANQKKDLFSFRITPENQVLINKIKLPNKSQKGQNDDENLILMEVISLSQNLFAAVFYYNSEFTIMEKSDQEYVYHMVIYDAYLNRIEGRLKIKLPWINQFRITVFERSITEGKTTFFLLAYDKDDESWGKFDSSKTIYLLAIEEKPQSNLQSEKMKDEINSEDLFADNESDPKPQPDDADDKNKNRPKFVYQVKTKISYKVYQLILQDVPKPLKIIEIIKPDLSFISGLVFYIKVVESNNQIVEQVIKCDLEINIFDEVDGFGIQSCKKFIDEPIRKFYMNGNYFIYTTTNDEIFFGIMSNKSPYLKKGILQKDWQILSVLFEKNLARIKILINNTKVTFVNDFLTNSFVWVYDDDEKTTFSHLMFRPVEREDRFYLVNFEGEKKLVIKDVTLTSMLVVDANDIRNTDLIEIRVDEHPIMDLKLKFWDGKSIIDLYENPQISVMKTSEGQFRTKIGFAGSNMHFQNDDDKPTIRYYNQLNYSIKFKDGFEIKDTPFLIRSNWVFFENFFVELSCKITVADLSMKCEEIYRESFKHKLNVRNVQKIIPIGTLLYFKGNNVYDKIDESDSADPNPSQAKSKGRANPNDSKIAQNYFFDTYTKKQEKFVGFNLIEGKFCKIIHFFVLCLEKKIDMNASSRANVRTKKNWNHDSLLMFVIDKTQLKPIHKFSIDFHNFMISEKNEVKLKDVTWDIVDFGLSSVDLSQILVIYKFKIEERYEYRVTTFAFEHFPNQKIDAFKLRYIGVNQKISRNDLIKMNPNMYVLNKQVIFLSFNPKFAMFCYDNESYYEFEYLDIQEVKQVMVLEWLSLIIIVYRSHQDGLFYQAVYRITQNAVKQLIRNEHLPFYSDNFRVDFNRIDEHTMAIIQYNMQDGTIYHSYLYYQNGPYLISNDINEQIYVDDRVFKLNLVEDENFGLTLVNNIKENVINIDMNSSIVEIHIKDYFSIKGNIKNLSLQDDARLNEIVQLKQLLTLVSDESLTKLNYEFKTILPIVKDNGKVKIFQNSDTGCSFTIRHDTKRKKDVTIDFKIGDEYRCDSIERFENTLFCFWKKQSMYYARFAKFEKPLEQVQIILKKPMINPHVIENNDLRVTVIGAEAYNKCIIINQYSKDKKIVKAKYVDKNEMNIDDLKVVDYHFRVDQINDKITVIMLDVLSNQLVIFHGKLTTLDQHRVLKRMIPLDKLDFSVLQIDCRDLDDKPTIQCILISAEKVFNTKITCVTDAETSMFKWTFEVLTEAYNILYEQSFDEDFRLYTQIYGNYFFTFEQRPIDISSSNPEKQDKSIVKKKKSDEILVIYNFGSDIPKYSKYILDIQQIRNILLMKPFMINKKLILKIYFLKNGTIRCHHYHVDNYQVKIKVKEALIGLNRGDTNLGEQQELDHFEVYVNYMNGNRNTIKFFLNYQDTQKEIEEERVNINQILLIVVSILFFFMICALFGLVYLMNKRRDMIKEQRKLIDAINNQANENRSLISDNDLAQE